MRQAVRLTVAAVVGAGLVVSAAPAAFAQIVPDVGMKGIKLDQRKKAVIRKLGQPKSIEKGTNDFGKYQLLHYRHKFDVTLQDKVVVQMRTKGKGQRTATGVGVGSTKRQVKNGVAGITCERIVGMLSCHTGDFNMGEPLTDFEFASGKVTMVIVARLLD